MDFLEIENQIKDLKIPESKILYQEPMRKYTTFKIGGLAECVIKIDNLKELSFKVEKYKVIKEKNIRKNIDIWINWKKIWKNFQKTIAKKFH